MKCKRSGPLRTRPADAHSIGPTGSGYRFQCAEEVRNIGARPIFLITPSTTQINAATESTGLPGIVMAFNNPRAYPNLYRSSVRRDEQHLTKLGSEEFTGIVAANFVELARAGEIK